ncbi:hypothetical protein TWF225_001339 [Orbilia oligospora]|uniref:Uncharacterized protein n=1 Tax=Orbilia oligospora TaxID=2813651 RepID=A0A7C8PBJ0_ORBOL|nr:hypothetical protein TWF751_008876 [Orbilia oligospora]KAF3191178.1 hypothetical protein TWF225_001339 [Orbilia oligospora]KAF3238700.1 hypothetical protein TWF128_011955 [Orbilia oligospora]KAF3249669.1 hypothetical protein TWF217_008862 [Orbilia oligospora]KAF3279282.1 hypothetical protein TWF132_000649 [Orbilia oligospora]
MQPIAIFAAATAFLAGVPQVSAHARFPECKSLLVTPAVKIPAPEYSYGTQPAIGEITVRYNRVLNSTNTGRSKIKRYYMRPFDAETLTQTQSLTQQLLNRRGLMKTRPGLPLQIAGFQINKDGGGPYGCKLDYTGSG